MCFLCFSLHWIGQGGITFDIINAVQIFNASVEMIGVAKSMLKRLVALCTMLLELL